jgi:imidazolonepropionase-like amidohydrolase
MIRALPQFTPRATRAKHTALALWLLISAAAAALPATATPVMPPVATPIALVGGTVHTVNGATLENATVVMGGGKILAVGTDVTPPPGSTLISVTGKHVYPGLISANTVLGLTEIESVRGTNDMAETGDVNPNVRAEVEFNPSSELLPVARVNGITSALVIPQGGAIAGTSALMHLDGWTWEDMTVRAPVALHVTWPNMSPVHAFFIQQSDEDQMKARDLAIERIGKAFDDARAYGKARDAEKGAGVPRHDEDVKWDAMGRALKGEIPVMFRASTLAQIHAVLKFADDQKLTKVVLVGGGDAWRVADELRARHIAVIADGLLGMPHRASDAYDENFTLPAKLAAAGISFCISDGGSGFGAMNARNLGYNAAMAAAYGLSRDEALKSVTLYPAQILGIADQLGSIETGKIADVIVTNGDPLDITTQIEQVYIAGKPTSMETRHTRLFHQYDARPRGPNARKP